MDESQLSTPPDAASRIPAPEKWRLPPILKLAAVAGGILVVQFQLLRALLLFSSLDLTNDVAVGDLANAFVVGARFDVSITAYLLLILLPLLWLTDMLLGFAAVRRVYVVSVTLLLAAIAIMGIAEVQFYREFFARFNSLALHYWEQPGTVLSMIWNGYPVVRHLILGLLPVFLTAYVLSHFTNKQTCDDQRPLRQRMGFELVMSGVAIALLVVAARGGLRGIPLSWGDAVHCESTYANQLAQNGIWSLAKAGQQMITSVDPLPNVWSDPLPEAVASAQLRSLMSTPGDGWAGQSDCPVLRCVFNQHEVAHEASTKTPPNVVVILMESFSARFCGACGADKSDDDYTPEFNRLANDGVLFDRCFSAGTHTHQANFAVVCGVPNLPGHESLMNDATLGAQQLDSLPRTLKQCGYETMYIYNGALEWENMRGFYRVQGIDHFVDRDDFGPECQKDSTWGVTDEELFKRANREFAQTKKPFFATICTLSNHEPFDLPRPLPFPEVNDQGSMSERFNGIRYADWALGQFFRAARKESYFDNTLFVLVGDHGFSVAPILTDLRLLRHHVPLLFYAPKLLPGRRVDHRVASQLDVMPTVLDILGHNEPHQFWGKNLFALKDEDPGWAYFKPSEFGEQLGFARGNLLVVKAGGGRTKLYRYDLGQPAEVEEITDDPAQLDELDTVLHAYVQTAAHALEHQHMLANVHDAGDAQPPHAKVRVAAR